MDTVKPIMAPAEFQDYLDEAITLWRQRASEGGHPFAIYYVDAFQSVRTTYFGEFLPPAEPGRERG